MTRTLCAGARPNPSCPQNDEGFLIGVPEVATRGGLERLISCPSRQYWLGAKPKLSLVLPDVHVVALKLFLWVMHSGGCSV